MVNGSVVSRGRLSIARAEFFQWCEIARPAFNVPMKGPLVFPALVCGDLIENHQVVAQMRSVG